MILQVLQTDFNTFVIFMGMRSHSYGIIKPKYKAVLIPVDEIILSLENGI